MKKTFTIGLAALALGLTSCSKEEVSKTDIASKSNEISFSTYSNLTKGAPYTSNEDFETAGNSFGVSAFIFTTDGSTDNNDSPYLGSSDVGAEIVYGTDWEHNLASEIRYWPTNGEELDFYAYTPYTDDSQTLNLSFDKTDGLTITGYTVPTAEADQVDFMFASALDLTSPNSVDDVLLQFSHGLVQVHFTANTTSSNMYVEIAANGISINNIYSSGNLDISSTTESTGAWSGQSDLASYTFTSSKVTIDSEGDSEAITSSDNSLMLLPQEFTEWNVDGDLDATDSNQTGAYLAITCKIYSQTTSDSGDASNVYLVGDSETYVTIYLPISSTDDCGDEIWVMGNKLTFDLAFGGGYDVEGDPIL
ncbi:MAG: fimbrillin family protein, partial [Rikenellaceae bacterium]